MKTCRLQVLVEEEQYRLLRSEADRRGVSLATVVREAIDERLPVAHHQRRAALQALLAAEPMPVPDDLADLRRERERGRGGSRA